MTQTTRKLSISVLAAAFIICSLYIGREPIRHRPIAVGVAAEDHSHARSPKWPKVRVAHLLEFPRCESCGGKSGLQVHHVRAFHCDDRLELDPANLITLCTDGPCNLNCHFVIGHAGNTKTNNPNVREDAARMYRLLHSGVDCELPK
jgi:hypothetical protein